MEIRALINHPERMDRDTLYELRSQLALYPYYQTLRLLMLQNLYLLHDPSFDEELRRAAIYITDRKVIFRMIEGAHYQLRNSQQPKAKSQQLKANSQTSTRTVDLIDSFLDNIPVEDEPKPRRKPTPADATIDYVAYLLQSEASEQPADNAPQMKGQSLIDSFLEQEKGRILLADLPTDTPDASDDDSDDDDNDEEYFTETLARIYIKQGRYQKALDILGRLSSQHPQKNLFFEDQMRFLEKLIINNSKNKN